MQQLTCFLFLYQQYVLLAIVFIQRITGLTHGMHGQDLKLAPVRAHHQTVDAMLALFWYNHLYSTIDRHTGTILLEQHHE